MRDQAMSVSESFWRGLSNAIVILVMVLIVLNGLLSLSKQNKENDNMDRHQFVEKLIGKRDALKTELDSLTVERDRVYARSATRFREMLKPVETETCSAGQIFSTLSNHFPMSAPPDEDPTPELAKVTDDDIIAWCADIDRLSAQTEKLQHEIIKLKAEDFAGAVAAAIADTGNNE